jgi:hypothetical protein
MLLATLMIFSVLSPILINYDFPQYELNDEPSFTYHFDYDGDGIYDSADSCANGTTGWTSNSTIDYDGDGCLDDEGWLSLTGVGNSSVDKVESVANDSSGNTWLTGSFTGTAEFGSTSLTSSGSDDIFVALMATNGTWSWAVKVGGSYSDSGFDIAIGKDGDAYVTGEFRGSASFGSTSLSSSGDVDVFVAKIDSDGIWQWAEKAGGSSTDIGQAIALDPDDDVYVTGIFYGTASFGSTSLISSGSNDIFVVKLNSAGSWQWAKKGGGSSSSSCPCDYSYGIAVDANGSSYVTGPSREPGPSAAPV